MAPDFTVRPLTSDEWPALEDLFGRAGASNGCWCMYWRLGPRYRGRPREENKRDLRRLAIRQAYHVLVIDMARVWRRLRQEHVGELA